MSNASAINIELGFSKQALWVCIVLHVLVILSISFILQAVFWLKCVLVVVCFLSLTYTLCQHVFRLLPFSLLRIAHQQSGDWSLLRRDGQVISAQLCKDSVITRYFLLLNFRTRWWRPVCACLIFNDATGKITARRLRSYL